MGLLNISEISGKILVIGSIYDKIDKIERRKKLFESYSLVIVNGNLCCPFEDISAVKTRISQMNEFIKSNKVVYCLGSCDLKLFNILSESGDHKDIREWIFSKPNVVRVKFTNQTTIIVVNGGIPGKIKNEKQLEDDIEISFVSYFNEQPWQNYYGGHLGYVIANHPLSYEKPKFYPYSMQMGNKYGEDTQIYAQEADQYGLKETILL